MDMDEHYCLMLLLGEVPEIAISTTWSRLKNNWKNLCLRANHLCQMCYFICFTSGLGLSHKVPR